MKTACLIETKSVSSVEREEFLAMATEHFQSLNPNFVPHEDWKQNYFNNILSNPHYFLRWIVVDGNHAGFILFGIEPHKFLPRMTGAIYELYVSPHFRRRGVARACAFQALNELQTYSPSKLQLEIVCGNHIAELFWKSVGFQKVSERWVMDRVPE